MNKPLSRLAGALLLAPSLASACWNEAASRHDVPAPLLYAIAQAESSLNPTAVNRSHLATTGTEDVGIMQVNTDPRVLKNLGLTRQALFDTCTNINAGARILSEKMARYGRTWEAVGAFNASCASLSPRHCLQARMRYAWKVYRFLMQLAQVPSPAKPSLSAAASLPQGLQP